MKPFGDDATLRRLLQQVKAGERSIEQAIVALQPRPLAANLGFATIDHDRAQRCGFPEVVFCQGKEPAQAAAIAAEILTRADRLLMTRADAMPVLSAAPFPRLRGWVRTRAPALRATSAVLSRDPSSTTSTASRTGQIASTSRTTSPTVRSPS